MNSRSEVNRSHTNHASSGEAESTLRLIAGLPAPDGLEERVKTALHSKAAVRRAGTLLEWPSGARGWLHSTFVRSAAAAAIVCVVAGGGWGVYQHAQPKESPLALPHVGAPGGFSSANAMRTPKTLDAPVLTHPVKSAAAEPPKTAKKVQEPKKKAAGKSALKSRQ